MSNKLTLLDFFCGAGGFSEGFRQEGFDIVAGYDHWEAATKTFNHNFGTTSMVKNILDFESSVEEIEKLPDTSVILGSPPCVTFSSSNISGKADKTSGITLTQIFLRIVAVKKWKKGSKLEAWLMENVPSSIKHLGKEYTFEELGLAEWAIKNRIGKSKVAIKLDGNQKVINSADYGCPQSRARVISGEIVKCKRLTLPASTHDEQPSSPTSLPKWRTLRQIREGLPRPSSPKTPILMCDPNYPSLVISSDNLTDHFYDTGLFKCEWKQSKFLKTNHPYMGKMAFPENEDRPSRTITATKIGTSREAIIFKSEYDRTGDGEFRVPTVREAACLMGFPVTYQFLGGITVKWRLVGNAVSPNVSRAFARQVRFELGLPLNTKPIIEPMESVTDRSDLNTFKERIFLAPPKRNLGSRFRRHPFKNGNMTVTLSNYDIENGEKVASHWRTSIQYGNGEGFPTFNVPDNYYRELEAKIVRMVEGKHFIYEINHRLNPRIAPRTILQDLYEKQKSENGYLEPTELVEEVGALIDELCLENSLCSPEDILVFKNKEIVPTKQVFALYAINKISSLANSK
ncbi:DNA cytosine methyltransferase [Dyadobacter sp. CY261]|uniref:DNA cytosine methyltransferase n=1 Tax=Dyadobacter sp. CY261 TaxID=2907203 RepID=UPI001F47467E|nr:DNA cytosine methyltransferase [Dyadobacter sp. CY261]MCF0075335.1 DNA cytosine methyltransferase [Dyadobacter sp. CY261]